MREVFAAAAAVLLVSLTIPTPTFSTPLSPQTIRAYLASNQGLQARNIRNLECVSRKTQEKGICMFALSCLKLNGTHLGVCVDRFYYGSCCKMPDDRTIEVGVGDGDSNDISAGDNTVFGKPPITEASVIEQEYSTLRPLTTVSLSTTVKPAITTSKPTPTPSRKPATTTKRPVTTKPIQTVTTKPVQSVTTKPVQSVTTKPVQSVTTKPVQSVTTKPVQSVTTKPVPSVTVKPSQSTSNTTQKVTTVKPITGPLTVKPLSPTPTKQPVTQITVKPVAVTTTQKPSTVAKPTNATRPVTKPTTVKPATAATPKPTIKPVSTAKPTLKPTSKPTPKPTVAVTSKPVITTSKPVPTSTISNEVVPSVRPESPDGPLIEPIEAEEEDTNTVVGTKPTTTKPAQTSAKPTTSRPSSNATKPSATKPTTVTPTKPTTPVRPTPPTWPPSTSQKPVVITVAPTTITTTKEPITITTVAPPSNTTESEWVQIDLTSPSLGVVNTTQGSPITEKIPTKPPATTEESITIPPATTMAPMESDLNMTDYKAVCGRRLFPEARIVGGTRTTFGKWPWQISLRQWRTSTYLHKCGAALLNENWAITAAHCVENVPPSDLLLRLGEHDLSTESEPYSHLERRVQIVASHPQFDARTFEYDLALLRFYEPVHFKPNVIPICIPDTDRNFVGSTAYVTGWGRLYEDGPLPSVMQEVSVPVIRNEECETMYRSAGYIEHIPHIFICAGWKKGGFDSCEGDSGGPMVIQREDNRWVLAGVISWGIGCAEPNQPGVYTRISEFRDWINQILQF